MSRFRITCSFVQLRETHWPSRPVVSRLIRFSAADEVQAMPIDRQVIQCLYLPTKRLLTSSTRRYSEKENESSVFQNCPRNHFKTVEVLAISQREMMQKIYASYEIKF